jgi:transposase InsO family protein
MGKGLKRDQCLEIVGLSKNQFYYTSKGTKPGPTPTATTRWRDPNTLISYEVDNVEVVQKIIEIKLNPDHTNWYRMIAVTLAIRGYYINHKKVYRLMQSYVLLEPPRKKTGRNFVQYRRVIPEGPLRVIEMDIKYIWIYEIRKYAMVLTVLDTFTRYVLDWSVGYSMKKEQVQEVWEYVVASYLQPRGFLTEAIDIEVRNDNGKQFSSHLITQFFKENKIHQVFTHPYTPEENGHVESFHDILGLALKKDKFRSLSMLEQRLERFYTCYNNDRSHSGTRGVPPSKFWALCDMDKIDVIPLEKRKVKFQLNVAYQDILTLPNIHRYDYRGIRA